MMQPMQQVPSMQQSNYMIQGMMPGFMQHMPLMYQMPMFGV
jgi:hypothetical protein